MGTLQSPWAHSLAYGPSKPPCPGVGPQSTHACHDRVEVVKETGLRGCRWAQEPMEVSASGPSPASRGVRRTLSRRSPYLPEVLPNLIDYADITLDTDEDGRVVLLGEGSFGQVPAHFAAPPLPCWRGLEFTSRFSRTQITLQAWMDRPRPPALIRGELRNRRLAVESAPPMRLYALRCENMRS